MIESICPNCGKKTIHTDDKNGKKYKCSKCNEIVTIESVGITIALESQANVTDIFSESIKKAEEDNRLKLREAQYKQMLQRAENSKIGAYVLFFFAWPVLLVFSGELGITLFALIMGFIFIPLGQKQLKKHKQILAEAEDFRRNMFAQANSKKEAPTVEPTQPVQKPIPPIIVESILNKEETTVFVPDTNVETLHTSDANVEAYPDYPFEETKSNTKKYILIGVITTALIVIIYFLATREKPVSSSAEIISEMPKQSDIHDQYLNVVPTPLPAETHSNIKQLSSKEIEAFADANRSDNWKIFNHKYGFKIELPSYFKEGSLTASGIQYYINDLNDNIMITVATNGIGSNSSLATDYQTTINSSSGIEYKILRNNWFVISGQDSEGIYYLKSLVKNGQTHYLDVRYPSSQKGIFDSILPRISKSFK